MDDWPTQNCHYTRSHISFHGLIFTPYSVIHTHRCHPDEQQTYQFRACLNCHLLWYLPRYLPVCMWSQSRHALMAKMCLGSKKTIHHSNISTVVPLLVISGCITKYRRTQTKKIMDSHGYNTFLQYPAHSSTIAKTSRILTLNTIFHLPFSVGGLGLFLSIFALEKCSCV